MPITGWLHRVEDGIYAVVGGALAIASAVLLLWTGWQFVQSALDGLMSEAILQMLDRLLLVLMLVEIMHTVRISIGKRVLVIEPFLVVGLIAVIRRVLIVTAEQAHATSGQSAAFQMAMLELGVLTVMILALVGAIYGLRKMSRQQAADEAAKAADSEAASQRARSYHTEGPPVSVGGQQG